MGDNAHSGVPGNIGLGPPTKGEPEHGPALPRIGQNHAKAGAIADENTIKQIAAMMRARINFMTPSPVTPLCRRIIYVTCLKSEILP